MSKRLLIPAAWLSFLLPACERKVPEQPVRPKNLIIISIDTLRADHLGCYRYARPTSPAIDAFAAGGVLFADASAAAPWTKPSHATLLTGLYPSRNGAISMLRPITDGVESLATRLHLEGFQTASIVNSIQLSRHGFEKGFDDLHTIERNLKNPASSPVTDMAIKWFDTRRRTGQPFFLLLHYFDVHSDYSALPKYARMFVGDYAGPADGTTDQMWKWALGHVVFKEGDFQHLRDLYDARIRQVDDELHRLFDYLKTHGILDDTLVVLAADHGEEFLDHGSVMHGHSQFDEVVRVPLILAGPGIPRGKRVTAPVSLVDVFPTCLDLLGLEVPRLLDGVPLTSLWQSEGGSLEPRLLFFEADGAFPPKAPGPIPLGTKRAARRGQFKLHFDVQSGATALYDLAADPAEKVDVQEQHPEVARELRSGLDRFLASAPPEGDEVPMKDDEKAALRAVGYIAGE